MMSRCAIHNPSGITENKGVIDYGLAFDASESAASSRSTRYTTVRSAPSERDAAASMYFSLSPDRARRTRKMALGSRTGLPPEVTEPILSIIRGSSRNASASEKRRAENTRTGRRSTSSVNTDSERSPPRLGTIGSNKLLAVSHRHAGEHVSSQWDRFEIGRQDHRARCRPISTTPPPRTRSLAHPPIAQEPTVQLPLSIWHCPQGQCSQGQLS